MTKTTYKMDNDKDRQASGCTVAILAAILLPIIAWAWWTDRIPNPFGGEEVAQVETPEQPTEPLFVEQPAATPVPKSWRVDLPHDLRSVISTVEYKYAVDLMVCDDLDRNSTLVGSAIEEDCTNALNEAAATIPTPTPDAAYEAVRGGQIAAYETAKADSPDSIVERIQGATELAVDSSSATMYSIDPRGYVAPTPIRGWQPKNLYGGK